MLQRRSNDAPMPLSMAVCRAFVAETRAGESSLTTPPGSVAEPGASSEGGLVVEDDLAGSCLVPRDVSQLDPWLGDPARSGARARPLPSRLVPHRHCPRAELQPAHELQVDMLG